MHRALGYSQTQFDPEKPGRLCRGRERWVEEYPLEQSALLRRLVISGAVFSDDTARDARRGLSFSELGTGAVLEALFGVQALLAFGEQGEPQEVPPGALLAESFDQPRYGGRRMDRCVRWRVTVQGAAEVDALQARHPTVLDGFLPFDGQLSPALEEALFLLTGYGERLGRPVRRYQPSAFPALLACVPWVACFHEDKHASALCIYSRERLAAEEALRALCERHQVLPVPFSIPPMLARWDRALFELRSDWRGEEEFPITPGSEHRRRRRRGETEE